jgi:hypothetical protein
LLLLPLGKRVDAVKITSRQCSTELANVRLGESAISSMTLKLGNVPSGGSGHGKISDGEIVTGQ